MADDVACNRGGVLAEEEAFRIQGVINSFWKAKSHKSVPFLKTKDVGCFGVALKALENKKIGNGNKGENFWVNILALL